MFFALTVCLFAIAGANPFHKYPYVFLLDIGNEELEKTNTEQIRLTIPGGSLALRYPALGNGDTIAHVRVSGIDFGTDLKANIIDGGPGYKYVVIVFMGNPGVPYDAVMTIQTVSDSDINGSQSNGANPNTSSNDLEDENNSAEVLDDTTSNENNKASNIDANDSSEDLSDDTELQKSTNGNAEISQASSNIYSYAQSEMEDAEDDDTSDDDEDDNDESAGDDLNDQKDIHTQYSESKQAAEFKDYQKYSDMSYEYTAEETAPDESENAINVDDDDDDESSSRVMDNSIYRSYAMIRPAFYGVRFYPQNAVPFLAQGNDASVYNPEDSVEFGNNESEFDKYRDSNNNFDVDDEPAAVS